MNTSTPFVITSTLPLLPTSAFFETPRPLPPHPTVAPVEGITSTQINVRADPSTASTVLGIVSANTKVEILGNDPGGNWLQIVYPHGTDEKGWVTAQYISMPNGSTIPIVDADETNPNNGNVAIVQQQINVRSGPGTSFNSLGTLNAQDVVNLTGKDSNGAWLQIEFSSGPDGKGWVNAAFVQATGVENIPIISEAGTVVGTATPTGIPFTPTASVSPARSDNDSSSKPLASIVFEPLGTHALIFSGDISAPEGDSQDWIQFTTYEDTVFASVACQGNGNLQIDLLENGQATSFKLTCGENLKQAVVKAGSVYLVHVQTAQTIEGLQYIYYTLTIQTSP